MAGLADSYTLGVDVTFQHKIQAALLKGAKAVLTAQASTPNSATLELARRVLANPAAYVDASAQYVAANDTTVAAAAPTGGGLTDAQIQTAVNALMPDFVR